MENFSNYSPTLIEFGRGSEEKVGMLMFLTGATKVLIVTGLKYARTTGLIDRVKNSLNTIGIESVELTGVAPGADAANVAEGIRKARAAHVDGILAIGGASVIDTAKAIAAGVPYTGDFRELFTGAGIVKEALPVGVVLTIVGAGSEVSGNCVITGEDGHKYTLRTDSLLKPRFAIVNPEMTATLTARQTVAGVMDMVTHILEQYFSPTLRVEMTDRLCEGMLMGLIAETPRVLADPSDFNGRANMAMASALAADDMLGCGRRHDYVIDYLVQEIEARYPDTSRADIAAVVIPAYLAFMTHHKPSKVAQLGRRIFAVDEKDDRTAAIESVANMRAFFKAVLRLPVTFEELKIEQPDIIALAEGVHSRYGETTGNYYKLKQKDTVEMFELMLSDSQRQHQMAATETNAVAEATPA